MVWITCVSSMHCSSYYSEAFSPWKCSRHFAEFVTPHCLFLGLRWTYSKGPQNLHLSFSRCSYAFTSFNGLLLPGSGRMSLLTCRRKPHDDNAVSQDLRHLILIGATFVKPSDLSI